MSAMSAKRNVAVNDSLLAEARRLAGARTSAATVNAALREFVGRRNGNGAAEKSARQRGGVEDLMRLSEYLRESGWDDTYYRRMRGLPPRKGARGNDGAG